MQHAVLLPRYLSAYSYCTKEKATLELDAILWLVTNPIAGNNLQRTHLRSKLAFVHAFFFCVPMCASILFLHCQGTAP